MPSACHYHRQSIFIAIIYAQLILDGTSRLDNTFDACFMSYLHTIREREESIAGHYRPFQIKIEGLGFVDGLV